MAGPKDTVMTTYLGNFAHDTANRIAEDLVEAKIVWWCKNPGTVTRIFFGEYGVRMFVDGARLEEAEAIAARHRNDLPPSGPP